MQVINGTSYHDDTQPEVIEILERALHTPLRAVRLRIHYGDIVTGLAWGDIETCYVGRSGGTVKIPLEIKNSRSLGGGGLLDNCIVKIEIRNDKGVYCLAYVHPKFHNKE